eukprot:3616616-Alexandrium_andersonii.AAC.1
MAAVELQQECPHPTPFKEPLVSPQSLSSQWSTCCKRKARRAASSAFKRFQPVPTGRENGRRCRRSRRPHSRIGAPLLGDRH